MTELIQQAANILSQAPELLKHPVAVPIITGFVQWLSSRVFAGKKTTQETLATITRGEANTETITKLKAFLELVMEDNEELRQELQAKLQEVESGLKQAGIQITKTNTANVTGSNNKVYQGISGSTITDNSVTQTHWGTGDNIGRDKVIHQHLYGSIDYQQLVQEIDDSKEILESIPESNVEARIKVSSKLSKLNGQLESFKEDFFRLYETLTKIPINTERLKLAKELFVEGKFREADVILNTQEMNSELGTAICKQEKSKKEYDEAQQVRDKVANEFLIKAQLWTTFYKEPDWFEKANQYYEQAIKASRNVYTLFEYALYLQKHNQFAKAESLYQEALELAQPFLNHSLPHIAEIYNNLGMIYQKQNKYKQAIKVYIKALQICNNMNGVDKETILLFKATVLCNYGNLLSYIGEYDKAQESYQEALQVYSELEDIYPSTYLPEVAKILNNLGTCHQEKKELKKAYDKYNDSLNIRRKLGKDNLERYLPDITNTLINLANLYVDMKNNIFAEKYYLEALDNVRKLSDYNPYKHKPLLASTLNNIAGFYSEKHKSRDLQKAETYFEESLSIRRKLADVYPDIYNPDLANSLSNLSFFYLEAVPNKEKSIAYATESIKVGNKYQHNSDVSRCLLTALQVLRANGVNTDEILHPDNSTGE